VCYTLHMRTCTICSHPERAAIEAAITQGKSLRDIARQFSVSKDAIARHKENCIKPILQEVVTQQEEQTAFSALAEMEWMRQQVRLIYADGRSGFDHRVSLQALGELRKQTELYSELTGELDRSTHIELRLSPEWMNVRDVIFAALLPYPEARVAVARALLAVAAVESQQVA